MDKKHYEFYCAICGQGFDDLEQRIKCETKCMKAKKDEEAKKAAEEGRMAKKKSEEAINTELAKIDKMLKEHYSKYNNVRLDTNYPNLRYVFSRPLFFL